MYHYLIDNETGEITCRGTGPLRKVPSCTLIASPVMATPGVHVYRGGEFVERTPADTALAQDEHSRKLAATLAAQSENAARFVRCLDDMPAHIAEAFHILLRTPNDVLLAALKAKEEAGP